MKYKVRLVLAAVLLLVAAAYLIENAPISGVWQKKQMPDRPFPKKMPVTLIVPPFESGLETGVTRYWKDGFTVRETRLVYEDGMIERRIFTESGVLHRQLQYFPALADQAPRLRSAAVFASDGRTYIEHHVYRIDGSPERAGRTLASGEYEHTYYFSDGKTVERVRVFDTSRRISREKIFSPKGQLVASLNRSGKNVTEVVLYGQSGKPTSSFSRTSSMDETGRVFASDGVTVLAVYTKGTMMYEQAYFDFGGRLVQKRIGYWGTETVSVLSPTRKEVIYVQRWRILPGKVAGGKSRTLRTVEELIDKKLYRTVTMDRTGATVKQITVHNEQGNVIKEIDLGGNVISVKTYGPDGKMISMMTPDVVEKISLPAEMLSEPESTALPEFSDQGAPPRIYDYP